MYQNQIIHVITGFKHDVSCIVRSEARRGHEDQSMHEARSAECIDVSCTDHARNVAIHQYLHIDMLNVSMMTVDDGRLDFTLV